MSVTAFMLVVGGYLLGSVPTAYLLARWKRGIDIRQIGSGNVGGSNLRAMLGVWATISVGLTDIAKGAVPVFLGQRSGLGETTAILAGLAAVVGHNWPPWLGFQGGRGIAATLGVLLVAFPIGVAWNLGFLALGALAHQVPLLNAAGVLTLPLVSHVLGERGVITGMTLGLAVLMIVKRLEANQRFKPCHRQVWIARLLHDRDVY